MKLVVLQPQTGAKARTNRKLWKFVLGVCLIYLGVGLYQTFKPLPAHLSLAGEPYRVAGGEVEFLYDVTGMKDGHRVCRQMIFDRVLGLIGQAQDFVLVDFFLFNPYLGKDTNVHRRLCQEVTTALMQKKRSRRIVGAREAE